MLLPHIHGMKRRRNRQLAAAYLGNVARRNTGVIYLADISARGGPAHRLHSEFQKNAA